MIYKIDLHVHSNISDGTYTPKEILELAAKKKIKVVALTDHDSIDGIIEAESAARNFNVELLKGIEITASYKDGRRLHILGLGLDINNEAFLKTYKRTKEAKHNSVAMLLSHLNKQGVSIDIDMLKVNSKSEYLDRYDIHRYFMKNAICNDAQEVWDKFLDPIPFGDQELLSVEEAIRIIKEAGGLSFLAHYNKEVGLKGYTGEQLEMHIEYLISIGLDGIERYYPSFRQTDIDEIDYLIKKYNLIPCGGTDFHGKNRPDIDLGSGINDNMHIPYSIYENIRKRLRLLNV